MSERLLVMVRHLSDSLNGAMSIVRAPAKINLRLKVMGRRPDGYHLLSMLNCTTSLCDELTLSFPSSADIKVLLEPEGVLQGESQESNLVVRAFRAFWRELGYFEQPPLGFSCAISKQIPIGAGLGGGSSDAGAVLRTLSTIFGELICSELGLSRSEFSAVALRAALSCGADVPYALCGGLCWVSGVGERVVPLSTHPIEPAQLVIIVPSTAVNTATFYNHFRRRYPEIGEVPEDSEIARFIESQHGSLYRILGNDFECAVCECAPVVADGLQLARRYFPHSTSVTGSGSAIFSLVSRGEERSVSELSAQAREGGYAVILANLTP